MGRMWVRAGAAGLLSAALMLAACGGGGGETLAEPQIVDTTQPQGTDTSRPTTPVSTPSAPPEIPENYETCTLGPAVIAYPEEDLEATDPEVCQLLGDPREGLAEIGVGIALSDDSLDDARASIEEDPDLIGEIEDVSPAGRNAFRFRRDGGEAVVNCPPDGDSQSLHYYIERPDGGTLWIFIGACRSMVEKSEQILEAMVELIEFT